MAPSAHVLRQLIVNARSLSDVAFTLLASFRGLAVSPRASFERHTLYHSRVIKQAVIFRAVFQSRPDLRCIEGHRRKPLPFFADIFLLDVCRFCRSLPAHRWFADERLSIRPGQGGADSSGLFVFGRLPEKPAHIEQKVFRDGSRRRGQQIIFRADCAIADSNRRYVRIRFHLRPVFLERVSEIPGHRPSRTSPSIQAALLDSHIDDICPRGGDSPC